MRRLLPVLVVLAALAPSAPVLAMTGNAPPATGFAARAIVMVIDKHGDLCTGTALTRELVLTAAHCVDGARDYRVRVFQNGDEIAVRAIARHPRYDRDSYARSRATADLALIKLASSLPDVVVPAALAAPRRVKDGETLTVAGFGTVAERSASGLGQPRMARLIVTGHPGDLQIRLTDPATRNARAGLGACNGDSGAPAYDGETPQHAGLLIGQIIGVVSWTTAAGNEEGCGGLTGLTPLLLYRSWIVDTARKLNAPLKP
jgi:secreted trypsin-like serine protease